MKFSEQWLREWVDPPVDTNALAAQLTGAGLEVDTVTPAVESLDGVIVGEVISVAPHPNADKLSVCEVNAGGDAKYSVVCGAPNVVAGMRAPLAVVGARLSRSFVKSNSCFSTACPDGLIDRCTSRPDCNNICNSRVA